MTTTPTNAEVAAAADAIVVAFAAGDTAAYFRGFAPDATFIFHPEPERLNSRAAYEHEWSGWLADGWCVTSCESTDQLIQAFPGGAVFSHTVATSIETNDGPDSYIERETIVFVRAEDGELVAIHEHLSTVPAAGPNSEEAAA